LVFVRDCSMHVKHGSPTCRLEMKLALCALGTLPTNTTFAPLRATLWKMRGIFVAEILWLYLETCKTIESMMNVSFLKGWKSNFRRMWANIYRNWIQSPDVIKNTKCDVPWEMILSRGRYMKLETKPISNNKLFAILMHLPEFLLKSFLLKKSTLKNS